MNPSPALATTAQGSAQEALHQFWTDKLAKAEAALEARREWLKAVKLGGSLFYSDRVEVAQVELCKRILAGHAEREARQDRIAKRQAREAYIASRGVVRR